MSPSLAQKAQSFFVDIVTSPRHVVVKAETTAKSSDASDGTGALETSTLTRPHAHQHQRNRKGPKWTRDKYATYRANPKYQRNVADLSRSVFGAQWRPALTGRAAIGCGTRVAELTSHDLPPIAAPATRAARLARSCARLP